MMDPLALYVGICRARFPTPPGPAELVACEAEGCRHLVWCDSARAPEWHVLKVVCTHCAEAMLPKVAS